MNLKTIAKFSLFFIILFSPTISESRLPPLIFTENWYALKAADDLVEETINNQIVIVNLYGNDYYNSLLAQHQEIMQRANELYYDDNVDLGGEDWQKFVSLYLKRQAYIDFLDNHSSYAQDFVDRVELISDFYSLMTDISRLIEGSINAYSFLTEYTIEVPLLSYMDLIFSGWVASYEPSQIYRDTINFCNEVFDHNGSVGRPGSIFRTVPLEGCSTRSYSAYCPSCSRMYARQMSGGETFEFNIIRKPDHYVMWFHLYHVGVNPTSVTMYDITFNDNTGRPLYTAVVREDAFDTYFGSQFNTPLYKVELPLELNLEGKKFQFDVKAHAGDINSESGIVLYYETMVANNNFTASSILASAGSLKVNNSVNLSIFASDPNGSSITYAWSSDHAGTFSNSTAATTTYTPLEAGTHAITVELSNGAVTLSRQINLNVYDFDPPVSWDGSGADYVIRNGYIYDDSNNLLYSASLEQNVSLNGDVYLESGSLSINGYRLYINGRFATGGTAVYR